MKNAMPEENEIADDVFDVKIDFSRILFDSYELGFALGYPEGILPEHFMETAEKIFAEVKSLCKPKAGYRIVPLTIESSGLLAGNVRLNAGKRVVTNFKNSAFVGVFCCTIGPAPETFVKEKLKNGDNVEGFIADTIASLITEQCADYLHDQIERKMAERGMKTTNRYSPGYCDWNVSGQHELFSLLPAERWGIKLADSALMLPVKSISGIIGIGKSVKKKKYECESCSQKECTYRTILDRRRNQKLKNKFRG